MATAVKISEPSIRRLTEEDIPWALDLAEVCYKRKLDRVVWTNFVKAALCADYCLILRGEESCVVGLVQKEAPDSPVLEGQFKYWFHHGDSPRELVRVFDLVLMWMKEVGVKSASLCPITGVDAGPLARVLGFSKIHPRYKKELIE